MCVNRRTCLGLPFLAAAPSSAFASGGATSGKTTSIPRAKLRYYGRVTTVVSDFEELGRIIDKGDLTAIKKARATFFSDADSSGIEELKSAGYLLAVAFKIDSKIPPQKIQQVRDHKVMLDAMTALGKACAKSPADAKTAYAAALSSLNIYLEGVELPLTGNERYKE